MHKAILKLGLLFLFISCGTIRDQAKVFDKELSTFNYPFDVYTFPLKSQRQNLQMRYGDLGNKDAKKVAVLLHGKNFSGYYWDKIARALNDKGYRVIIPDQIGFGKSSKPENYQFSFAQLALNTHQLLEGLGVKKYTIVGHSMGGMLAVHMASLFNDVDKVVLINPIGLEDYLNYVEIKDPEFFYQDEVKKAVTDFRNYQRKHYYAGEWKEEYENLLTPVKGWREGKDWELIAWNSALTYGPIFSEGIVKKLADLKTPTYLILGTRDRTAPGSGFMKPGIERKLGQYQLLGHEVKKRNPKIQLIEFEGLGHMPQFEDYQKFSSKFYPIFAESF